MFKFIKEWINARKQKEKCSAELYRQYMTGERRLDSLFNFTDEQLKCMNDQYRAKSNEEEIV